MPKPADLVYMQTVTTGTGDLTVEEVTGKRTFSGAFSTGSGNTFDYFVSARATTQWERGVGYCSVAGTLVRQTVEDNNLGTTAKIAFGDGTKDVLNDIPASRQVQTTDVSVTTGHGVIYKDADGTVIGTLGAAPLTSASNIGPTTVSGNLVAASTAVDATGFGDVSADRLAGDLTGNVSATTVNAVSVDTTNLQASNATVNALHVTGSIQATTLSGTLVPNSTNVDLGSAGAQYGEIHANTLYSGGYEKRGILIAEGTSLSASATITCTWPTASTAHKLRLELINLKPRSNSAGAQTINGTWLATDSSKQCYGAYMQVAVGSTSVSGTTHNGYNFTVAASSPTSTTDADLQASASITFHITDFSTGRALIKYESVMTADAAEVRYRQGGIQLGSVNQVRGIKLKPSVGANFKLKHWMVFRE